MYGRTALAIVWLPISSYFFYHDGTRVGLKKVRREILLIVDCKGEVNSRLALNSWVASSRLLQGSFPCRSRKFSFGASL